MKVESAILSSNAPELVTGMTLTNGVTKSAAGLVSKCLRDVNNSPVVQNHPYKGGLFSGVLRNGKPFNGEVKGVSILYKTFCGNIVDGALTYSDRSRLPAPGVVTPFQRTLRGSETPFQRLETSAGFKSADELLRRNILNLDSGYCKLSTNEKFSVNNDNQRRLFDTIFGREMISRISECEHSRKQIRDLSDKILLTYKNNIVSEAYVDWQAACAGTYCGKDGRFQQLISQNHRIKEAVEVLDVSVDAKKLLVDIYQRRYLNYLVDETDLYKNDHPVGMLKSKTDPFYFKRGRLDGDFACRDSLNMGILRNVDQAPGDLRFAAMAKKKQGIPDEIYTRCPDRLNMADPSGVVDRDADSWLTYNFLSGNTPYVNGLSGSMLIEIRGILYLKEKITEAGLETDFLSAIEMVDVLDNYFRLVAGLYVYVDGGHSLFEIQSSFKQKWVKGAFISTFEGLEWGEIGQDLYSNPRDFERAYQATKQFDKVLQNRQSVHNELAFVQPDMLVAKNKETSSLALQQSIDARHVLYHPGDSLREELAEAALTLYAVISALSIDSQVEICAHLLGQGRLLGGKSVADVLCALQRVGKLQTQPDDMPASATDRVAVIALLGDIGGFYTTPTNASDKMMAELNDQILALGLHIPDMSEILKIKSVGGSATVGPDKRAERRIKSYDSRHVMPYRAGVHNMGVQADADLNIPLKDRIPPNRWVVFDINMPRIKELIEPLVGHMSASPSEILQAWDMFRGVKAEDQYLGALSHNYSNVASADLKNQSFSAELIDPIQQYARAAGTTAFLLGLGYHSAVEVIEGVLSYTGQSIRSDGVLSPTQRDAGDIFGQGAATSLLTDLLRHNTKQ